MEKAAKTQTVVDKIIEVADYSNPVSIQAAYLQLRYCAEPKIAHLLRVGRPDLVAAAAAVHDTAVATGLNALLGV